MELLQLRYFVEIARYESMKEASARLYVSQPSLSQSVRRLENELGVELFRHEGRNLRLTEQGRVFFLGAEKALRELDNACGRLDGHALQGNVTLGTYMPIVPLADCLKAFVAEYPYITFDIYMVSSGLAGFDPGALDMLLYYQQSNHLDFHEHVEIGVAERRWILPAGHPLENRESLSMSDMEQEAFVSMRWGKDQLEELFQDYSHAGVTPLVRYRTNSFRIKQEIMEAGLAVGSSNDLLAGTAGKNCVSVRQEGTSEKLYLGWRAECYQSPAARAFSEFSRDWFLSPEHRFTASPRHNDTL